MAEQDFNSLNKEVQSSWNQNASFWNDYMGEGGFFHQELIAPITEKLLAVQPGQKLLDLACGNGSFSRRLAKLGAKVIACDFSAKFLELAKNQIDENIGFIDYKLLDVTDEYQLLALGISDFDAAVCIMGIMDIATIEPLFTALNQLIKPGGSFVFSILHPCFNSGNTMIVEQQGKEKNFSVKISKYLTPRIEKGKGIPIQPIEQYYFYRPLSVLFASAFQTGFVLDALEEPQSFRYSDNNRDLSWWNYSEIPPILIARMRKLNQ